MIIDVFQDMICPFCRIGESNLQKAIKQWQGEEITLNYRSFFLNYNTPAEGMSFEDYMKVKGAKDVTLDEFLSPIIEFGKTSGLNFNYDKLNRIPSTKLAHQFLTLVPNENKEALLHNIYNHFFEFGSDIGNLDMLLDIGDEVGLDPNNYRDKLEKEVAHETTVGEFTSGLQLGITGVPYFIIDKKIAMYGAQPVEKFLQFFEQAIKLRDEK